MMCDIIHIGYRNRYENLPVKSSDIERWENRK